VNRFWSRLIANDTKYGVNESESTEQRHDKITSNNGGAPSLGTYIFSQSTSYRSFNLLLCIRTRYIANVHIGTLHILRSAGGGKLEGMNFQLRPELHINNTKCQPLTYTWHTTVPTILTAASRKIQEGLIYPGVVGLEGYSSDACCVCGLCAGVS